MPGSLSSMLVMPPMLFICCNWSRKSEVELAAFDLARQLRRLCPCRLSCSACSMRRARPSCPGCARPGDPVEGVQRGGLRPPQEFDGFAVMARTDRARPPRVSPSTLVRMTPVSGSASPNALAVFAASWLVIASTTNRVSTGWATACAARQSPPSCPRRWPADRRYPRSAHR